MKKHLHEGFIYIAAFLAIILLAGGMMYSLMRIEQYARNECYEKLEDSTEQSGIVIVRTMAQYREELRGFGEMLVANLDNDNVVNRRFTNFAEISHYDGFTLLKRDGSILSRGNVPQDFADKLNFAVESRRQFTVDTVLKSGAPRAQQYVYHMVPIFFGGQKVALLYGYIDLDSLAKLVYSGDYNGEMDLILVAGSTGDILVREKGRSNVEGNEVPLGNIYIDSPKHLELLDGRNWNEVHERVRSHKSGYLIAKSKRTGKVYYTCRRPLEINNWQLMGSVEESLALAVYDRVKYTILFFFGGAVLIIALMIVLAIMAVAGIKKSATLQAISTSDYLTGVGNRYAMYDFVQRLLPGQSVGVIYCDITGLKLVNDQQGHQAGDDMIRSMCETILDSFSEEQVFRLGGDEFLILATEMSRKVVERKLRELQERWEQKHIVVAVGYQWLEDYDGDAEKLTEAAEQRMYAAKGEWYRKNAIDRRKN